MKTAILLLACLPLLLASCVVRPVVMNTAKGGYIASMGGVFAAKTGATVAQITTKNGDVIKFASEFEDGTEVPKYLANMYTAAKLAEMTANSADLKTTTDADVAKHTSDNALAGKTIEGQSKAYSEGLTKAPPEAVTLGKAIPPGGQ